ncbi:NAD(P)/FAD-dependent oxidoreductase [Salinicoccus cyprini]|uniref:NAD(P)/FAD-dependent oxidoreductase n=1 Tax=Salinicoccus cyprini TaxID=2493691 RepID=A0A558ATY0_9STAP|nr:NAD(P)/FAD-dependent oxidoreductase [Salinicoccus cyprini]TVT27732.1 NAD(P)/FAD-dependent oxidoreductase [Salinicoccus cyprini]
MANYDYDVTFIGSGHAAWHAALTLRQAGKSVAIIEKDTIAGTCTNYGCNPKILLEGPFEVLEELGHYKGILSQDVTVDWPSLMEYKEQVINPMSDSMQQMMEHAGIDIHMGYGKLQDAHTIEVDGKTLTSDNIVVATGQHSNVLDITGKEYAHTSREFMDLGEMPKRITFIGGGIITFEFASIAIKTGAEVHIINHSDEYLGGFHTGHVDKLMNKLKVEGVQFHSNESTTEIVKNETDYTLKTESGLNMSTDYIVDATGRVPNVAGIGLENAGVRYSKKGVEVDSFLRTAQTNIYASGDVLDKDIPKLTPTATFESDYIAAHILGMNPDPIEYPAIPMVLYTLPRLSSIGVTVAEAEEDDNYTVKTVKFGERMVFEYKNETEAEMDIVLNQNKQLVGVEIYGNDAADLVNVLTFAVNQQITVQNLSSMIFAFPSPSSGVLDLLKFEML